MLRKIIVLVLLIVLASVIGSLIAKDPGYVFLAYQHWTVEMPLWLLLSGIISIVFLIYLTIAIFQNLGFFFAGYSRWQKRRSHKNYTKKTNQSISLLMEGQWKAAERAALKVAADTRKSLINYLIAAKSSYRLGQLERSNKYLDLAKLVEPNALIAISLIQAKLQIDSRQFELALPILCQLKDKYPKHPEILKTLIILYEHLNNWDEILKLLPILKKIKAYSKEEYAILETKVFRNLIDNHALQLNYVELKKIWDSFCTKQNQKVELLIFYVKQLIKLNHHDKAEVMIRTASKAKWSAKLAYQYGRLQSANKLQQLQVAENWLKQYGPNEILYLVLGRIAKSNQLWGQAKSYFKECLLLSDNLEAHYEYAELLFQLGEQQLALEHYRKGLMLSVIDTNRIENS